MIVYAVLILIFAAVTGLLLASRVLKAQFAPWVLSLLHALFGATALALLGLTLYEGSATRLLIVATATLVVAALGGFFLASFHLRSKIPPKPIVFVHAGVAVTGFLLVLATAFGG